MFYTWGVQDRQRSLASLKTELWGAQGRRRLHLHPIVFSHLSVHSSDILHRSFTPVTDSFPLPSLIPDSEAAADPALALIHTRHLGHQRCFKPPSCHTEVTAAAMRTPAPCPTVYLPFLMPPQKQSLHSHPIAHSLGAIHGMQGMAAKLPGR